MARIRTIKPEFWTAEQVMELSRDARLLFIGMWNFCDDMGVHPAAYKTLKAEVFPGDDITSDDVKRMVGEIIQQGLLGEFEHEGRGWWYVTGWKHQLINRPSTSRYPRPPRVAPLPLAAGPDGPSGKGLDDSAETETAAVDNCSTHDECAVVHGVLTEDSLRTHGGREGKGKERKKQHQIIRQVQRYRRDPIRRRLSPLIVSTRRDFLSSKVQTSKPRPITSNCAKRRRRHRRVRHFGLSLQRPQRPAFRSGWR